MAEIRDLVARRTDLSTFVVHLTRASEDHGAHDNLLSIIRNRQIEARSSLGSAMSRLTIGGRQVSPEEFDSQKVVSFTETPLQHLYLMLESVDDLNRNIQLEPYGIALTKALARRHGINPVWYIDITPGHNWLTVPLNRLIDSAIENGFPGSDIASLTPFIEQMGTGNGYRKEFWWEREWRYRGNFQLPPRVIVIAPEEEHDDFDDAFHYPCVDAKWGLEEIIARLAGFGLTDVGPF